jgi:hypothetical protein
VEGREEERWQSGGGREEERRGEGARAAERVVCRKFRRGFFQKCIGGQVNRAGGSINTTVFYELFLCSIYSVSLLNSSGGPML